MRASEIASKHLGDDPVRAIVRRFTLGIQAIRLFECGWENHINDYCAPELLILSELIPSPQREIVQAEALRRADQPLLDDLESAGIIEKCHA